MPYTLGEAAKHTGLSKPTIQRAIKSGKLSASRKEDGSYSIDPAELERVYSEAARSSNADRNVKQRETPENSGVLHTELAVLREKLSFVIIERERERDQLNRQIEDLQQRLDMEAQARRTEGEERRKLTAILTDQRSRVADQAAAISVPVAERPKGWRGLLARWAEARR